MHLPLVHSFISSSEMKKKKNQLILSFVIVMTALIVLDAVVGVIGDYSMRMMPSYSGQLAKNNYRLNRVDSDILIIGSSRGAHHYVTSQLCDSINRFTGRNYTGYNSSIDGNFINSNCCAAESVMERYSPKLLILEVSEWELSGGQAIRDMEFTAGNYRNNKVVKKYLDNLGWKERVKMKSNMYRFNQKTLRIVSSYIQKGEETGYEPLYDKMTVIPERKNNPHFYDEYSMTNFFRVLEKARKQGVNIVIVSSPSYRPVDGNEFLADICVNYNIPYIDCYNIDVFNNKPEWFKDVIHLNDDGAHEYTALFFDKLKPYLLKFAL